MPSYQLTSAWSDPIPVAANDYAQNKGAVALEICAATPASSADALLLPPLQALIIAGATSVRARSTGSWPAELAIAGGL